MHRIVSVVTLAALLFAASPALAADTTGPEISQVSPLEAQYTVPQTFSVTATDESDVASCTLVVSSVYETPMTFNASSGQWEVVYTFETYRSANSIRARCTDGLGNEQLGPSKIIQVDDAPIVVPDGDGDADGDGEADVDATEFTRETIIEASPVLIKTVCPGGEDFTHPCRTVYFLDDEGVRHAFPNERAFFTWYDDYDGLYLITEEMMASYALGRNVRYKPGVKMVKFRSLNTVYAVGRYGQLRAIASQEVAADLYGANWNQQIDDISEVFATNYTFEEDINDASEFDPASEEASVDSINDNRGTIDTM